MASAPRWLESDVRLVLVTPHDSTLVLDGLVNSDASSLGRAGWPISIELERAETAWFDAAMERVLIDWAREARVLCVALAPTDARPQARLDCGGTSVRAHLVRVA